MKFIVILLNRMVIQAYTSEVTTTILQNRGSIAMDLITIIIFLLIWFSCGLILAYWVKKHMKKRNLEGNRMFFLILLTSFIGFIIYMIINNGEIAVLENGESHPEFDEIIKEEEEEEIYDEIEEISEEELEDIIETILEDPQLK